MRILRQFTGVFGNLHRGSRVGVKIKMRSGPDFLRGKSSRCCNAGSKYAAVLPVPVGAEPVHHGHRAQAEWRQPEWRSGRVKPFFLEGIQKAFIEFKFGKSRYSHVHL